MTEKEFTNEIDGLINDYEGGISTSKELRDGILDTLIKLVSKVSPFEALVIKGDSPCAVAEENPLESIKTTIAFDSKDYSLNKRDAWIYGIVCGWDDALDEVCKQFNWDESNKARLKRLNEKYQRATAVDNNLGYNLIAVINLKH